MQDVRRFKLTGITCRPARATRSRRRRLAHFPGSTAILEIGLRLSGSCTRYLLDWRSTRRQTARARAARHRSRPSCNPDPR